MKDNELILKRREFLNSIQGKWESDEFIDNEKNKIRIIIFIDNNFDLIKDFVLNAIKKYSETDLRKYPIVFWWLDSNLTTSSMDLKQGILAETGVKDEIGFYIRNEKIIDRNLILRFKKI